MQQLHIRQQYRLPDLHEYSGVQSPRKHIHMQLRLLLQIENWHHRGKRECRKSPQQK